MQQNMRKSLPHRSFLTRLKNIFGFGSHVHGSRAALRTKERVAELQQQLVQRRMQEQARQTTQAGDMTVPSEWREVFLQELIDAYEGTKDPERADQLSVRAWGLVRNAARLFAQDGHALIDADIDALTSVLTSEESPSTVNLYTIVERVGIKGKEQEELRVRALKATGAPQPE